MWMFWVPIAIVTFVVWWQFAEQIVLGHPQGSEPIPDWAAWVLALVFGLGFPAFAFVVRFITEVEPGWLILKLYPFHTARIDLKEVTEAEVREYSALQEYGGWGIRVGRSGKAYSAYGTVGVQLWLKGDKRVLIGSQRSDELADALRLAGARVR
jgi:hypothetical protein